MKRFAGFLIVLAGCFWGIMGVFVRTLTGYGFTTMQIAAMRLTVAAVILWIALALFRPSLLKIRGKDLPLLAVLGVVSMGAMCVLYFTTIRLSTMSAAAVLLYLSPVAVMLMSALFLKEKITVKKVIALVLAVSGCGLVSGIAGGGWVGTTALLTGIGSAVTYGSYSILGSFALKKHHPFTVTVYAFSAAAVLLLCLCRPADMVATAAAYGNSPVLAGLLLGLGICTAVIPFVLYTCGLRYTPASRAAVLACSEPVAATVFGWLFYKEQPDGYAYAGMVLVMAAIVLLSGIIGKKKKNPV